MAGRALALILAALVAAGSFMLVTGRWQVPDRHNPWAPLRLDDPPNWMTGFKRSRLAGDPAACRAVLNGAGWQWQPVPDRDDGPGCSLRGAVRVERLQAMRVQPFVLSCPAAVSLALWERHSLQPQARRWFGRTVARLEHFGTVACRNLYGRAAGPRSRHATGDAIDVAGLVLDDGRRVVVRRDWGGTSPEAAFLRQVHDGACEHFDVVLGPEANAAHADHLHLDVGGGRACR